MKLNKNGKHPGGRPTKYKPEYCKQIVDYFSVKPFKVISGREVANDLPQLSLFAHSIGVNQDTLHEWNKNYPEFSEAFKKAKELQEAFLLSNGLSGRYQQPAFIFTMKNVCKWTDRQEIKHEINDLAAEMEEARKRLRDE